MRSEVSLIRAFFAIELPEPIQTRIATLIHEFELKSKLPVRWVPVKNIHLTLRFLGEVQPEPLKSLAEAVADRVKNLQQFTISLGELGAFPFIKRPRVIWVGISAQAELKELAHRIERIARQMGFANEDRHFSPHLTLGRVQQHATVEGLGLIQDALAGVSGTELGDAQVDSLCLFRSDRRPTGAVYTLMGRYSFRG